MNLVGAYEKLGLIPLEDFLERSTHSPEFPRRIGATTWMLVSAALEVMKGKHVILVGRTMAHGETLLKQCRSYLPTLEDTAPFFRQQTKTLFQRLDIPGVLEYSSERTYKKKVLGKPALRFIDSEWALKALNRTKDPYTQIRSIVKTRDNKYRAYSAEDIYLLQLTKEGARDIVETSIRVSYREE